VTIAERRAARRAHRTTVKAKRHERLQRLRYVAADEPDVALMQAVREVFSAETSIGDPCVACGVQPYRGYYYVHDHVWASAGFEPDDNACVECLATQLGRDLTADDFPPAAVNAGILYAFSLNVVAVAG